MRNCRENIVESIHIYSQISFLPLTSCEIISQLIFLKVFSFIKLTIAIYLTDFQMKECIVAGLQILISFQRVDIFEKEAPEGDACVEGIQRRQLGLGIHVKESRRQPSQEKLVSLVLLLHIVVFLHAHVRTHVHAYTQTFTVNMKHEAATEMRQQREFIFSKIVHWSRF